MKQAFRYRLSCILLFCSAVLSSCTGTGTAGEERTGLQEGFATHACTQRIVSELATVRDEYRSHVYGSRIQKDGDDAEVLVGGTVPATQTGIFATKKRMTSELVWPLVESYRTLRCDMLSVCSAMENSLYMKATPAQSSSSNSSNSSNPLSSVSSTSSSAAPTAKLAIRILGCKPQEIEAYDECMFAGDHLQSDALIMRNSCTQLVKDTLEFERASLRLATAYDANYRALLQTSGMLDWMIYNSSTDNGKGTFIIVRRMINLLGKLHQIPCFSGQCDSVSPTDLGL